jgi:hypothetical protein
MIFDFPPAMYIPLQWIELLAPVFPAPYKNRSTAGNFKYRRPAILSQRNDISRCGFVAICQRFGVLTMPRWASHHGSIHKRYCPI